MKCIWQRRFSGVTALFLLNRYVGLSNRLVNLVQLQSWRGFPQEHADYVSAAVFHSIQVTNQVHIVAVREAVICARISELIGTRQVLYRVEME